MSESRAIAALQEQRRAVSEATLADAGFDLASLTEEQFEGGLQRIVMVQSRAKRILAAALTEGVHYGNPKDSKGNKAFQRPILYKSGAQEVRRLMKLRLHVTEKTITETEDYVSVVLEVVALDTMRRVVGRSLGACNTREKRFKAKSSDAWLYRDAREKLHDCLMMAEKRGGVAATLEACGATGLFADEDLLNEAIEESAALGDEREEASSEQKSELMKLAAKRGFRRHQFIEWLGRENATGLTVYADQVTTLIGLLESAKPPAPSRKVEAEVVEAQPTPTPAPPADVYAGTNEPPQGLFGGEDDLPFP